MAQRVITYVQYTDDLTGETFAEGEGETLVYVLDGASYEIDLIEANAKAFRETLTPFLQVSRKTVDTRGRKLTAGGGAGTHGGTAQRGPDKKPRRSRTYMNQVREWGRSNGFDVPAPGRGTGRVPEDVVAAFETANPELAWKA